MIGDDDDECAEGLGCYQRPGENISPVPGCSGEGRAGKWKHFNLERLSRDFSLSSLTQL